MICRNGPGFSREFRSAKGLNFIGMDFYLKSFPSTVVTPDDNMAFNRCMPVDFDASFAANRVDLTVFKIPPPLFSISI
jgi:hypothetical protein